MKERVIMNRSVDPRILIDNANHNILAALADQGVYTCRDRVEFFGKKGMYDINRVLFQTKSRVWDMHNKALKLGVSINWLLYHVPRDGMPKEQSPEFKKAQKKITREQMRENIASHLLSVRKDAGMLRNDYYYMLTGDRDIFLHHPKVGSNKVAHWEKTVCFPPIYVVAALARAEEVTVDKVLYTLAPDWGMTKGRTG